MHTLSLMGPEFNLSRKKIQKELILTEMRKKKKRNLRITPRFLQLMILMVCGILASFNALAHVDDKT